MMKHRALVIGHADADGHLIAEQVRRNLALIDSFDVQVVVDPARTKDHTTWMRLDLFDEVDDAEYVFFVDLMFAPGSFLEEADALIGFVGRHPEKHFFLLDHHPLPLARLAKAKNLRVMYRPDVFDCTIGPRSGMMIVAALCEKQVHEVADIKQPVHTTLALGVRRAAAPGGPLPGQPLLTLLEHDYWDALFELGCENAEFHQLPRGRRSLRRPHSRVLDSLGQTAASLSAHHDSKAQARRLSMPYDTDIAQERFVFEDHRRVREREPSASPKDLEAIMTLLEVAAISLTVAPGAKFTLKQLIDEARKIGGEKFDLAERDARIVLDKAVLKKANFLARVDGQYQLR
jgi:hypothetical protein